MDTQKLELLARVASMYYEENMTQQKIALETGYSRSMVSRLLTDAQKYGVVEVRIHYPLERCTDLEQELQTRLGLTTIQVLARGALSYDQMLRRLGALAARLVENLIREETVVGVSWGTALREMANALQLRTYTGVKVVQIIGALDAPDPEIDGPDLARNLAHTFGGQYFTLAAPLLVEDKATRDALLNDRRIRRVMHLATQMRLALMGIGTIDARHSSILRAGYISPEGLDELARIGAVGDVCAIHFNLQGEIIETPLNERRVGISVEALRAVPFKVGISGGESKALSVLGACRAGLVNHLVTDEVAALGALRAMEGE